MNHAFQAGKVFRRFVLVAGISLIAGFLLDGGANAKGACVVNPKFLQAQRVFQSLPRNQVDSGLGNTWSGLVARQRQLMNQACQQIDPICDQADSMVRDFNNSGCHGELPADVYQSCVNRRAEVQAAVNQCNTIVPPYNAAVDSWVADLNSFMSRVREIVATNCKLRSELTSRWNEQRNQISVDEQVISNLNAAFVQHAAKLEAYGGRLSEMQHYIEQVDEALDHLKSHLIAIESLEDVSEAEVKEYEFIAKGLVASTGDIIKIVATVAINSETEAVTAELSDMRTREGKLVDDVASLRQLRRKLAETGPCDSTILAQ